MNARELRALHLYSVRFSNGQNKQIDELELVELIGGEEVFQALPEYSVTPNCPSRIEINSVPSESTQPPPPSIP
jgi:hypothetical protein